MPWPRDPAAAPAPGGRPGACTTTTRRRSTACAGRCMRAGRSRASSWQHGQRDRGLGRARPRRPDLQRRQDLPRAARRRRAGRAACCPTRTSRSSRRLPGIGFDDAHNRADHLGPPADADQRVGGQLLRPARQGRPLAQGGARPAPGRRPEGRRAAAAGAGHATGNTTTCASTSCRWRCCTCSAGRCRRCFSSACCGRSAAATASPGAATTTPGSSCPASAACSRCRAARTGAAACRSARATRRAIGQLLLDGGAGAGRQLVPRAWIERDGRALRRSRRSTAG